MAEFDELALAPTFGDFVCMYIGEGYKRDRNRVAIGNSDPRVVRLAAHWLRRFSKNPVRHSVQYHVDQDLAQLTRFWAAELSIRPSEIQLRRKSNSGKLAGRHCAPRTAF